ncbi:MAG: hypothetical protein AAF802_18655 [Planctomycetota bacterium]
MTKRRALLACVLTVTGFAAGIAYGLNATNKLDATSKTVDSSLPSFVFRREAADTPETAAMSMFRGVSSESPKHFVQHVLLGVCDGSIDTLQKFAEALHMTKFDHDDESLNFYELRESRRGWWWLRPSVLASTVVPNRGP